LNREELENKIWLNASSWISKTKLWESIIPKCDKKTCFDCINRMIPTQLKKRDVGNRIEVVRIDMTRRAEFENALKDQVKWLGLMRKEFLEYSKPMFHYTQTITHYKPPLIIAGLTEAENRKRVKEFNNNPKFRKTFKIDEIIRIWKTRPNVRKTLENMKFYYTGLFIFISRTLLQKSLGIISTKEANIRIKKCEKALEEHFDMILSLNPTEIEAIKQFYEHGHGLEGSQYNVGSFRI